MPIGLGLVATLLDDLERLFSDSLQWTTHVNSRGWPGEAA
jgi:hypothetical protein